MHLLRFYWKLRNVPIYTFEDLYEIYIHPLDCDRLREYRVTVKNCIHFTYHWGFLGFLDSCNWFHHSKRPQFVGWMLVFGTFCLFYRFTRFFFGGGRLLGLFGVVWFVWSGLFGSFLFPSLFVSLFACWAMNSRNPSIVKILQKHVLFETWNATHWYHANLMIHDDSALKKTFEIQGSGYNDVGRSFKATAGFNRNDKAPGVGSWNQKTQKQKLLVLHQSHFFWLVKTRQKKKHTQVVVFLEEVCQQNAVVEGQEP